MGGARFVAMASSLDDVPDVVLLPVAELLVKRFSNRPRPVFEDCVV